MVYVDLTEQRARQRRKVRDLRALPGLGLLRRSSALLKSGAKVSVGYNPWSGKPLDTDISAICARYGGGGHPVVGAISFTATEVERAREIARAIAEELA